MDFEKGEEAEWHIENKGLLVLARPKGHPHDDAGDAGAFPGRAVGPGGGGDQNRLRVRRARKPKPILFGKLHGVHRLLCHQIAKVERRAKPANGQYAARIYK